MFALHSDADKEFRKGRYIKPEAASVSQSSLHYWQHHSEQLVYDRQRVQK
jgi:hypothetical protein